MYLKTGSELIAKFDNFFVSSIDNIVVALLLADVGKFIVVDKTIIELETIFDESITQYNNRQPITPLDKDTLEKAYTSLIQNKHRVLQFKIKTKQTETTSRTSTNSFYLALGGSYWMLMNYPTNGYSTRPKYLSIFSGTYYYIS